MYVPADCCSCSQSDSRGNWIAALSSSSGLHGVFSTVFPEYLSKSQTLLHTTFLELFSLPYSPVDGMITFPGKVTWYAPWCGLVILIPAGRFSWFLTIFFQQFLMQVFRIFSSFYDRVSPSISDSSNCATNYGSWQHLQISFFRKASTSSVFLEYSCCFWISPCPLFVPPGFAQWDEDYLRTLILLFTSFDSCEIFCAYSLDTCIASLWNYLNSFFFSSD